MAKKGIIVEQKRNKTYLMTSDGSFYKARKLDGSVGEETSFEPLSQPGWSFDNIIQWFQSFAGYKTAAVALIAFLLIFPFYSWHDNQQVHAYVNIDINPSVELSVNDDYEVIDLVGLNDDGEKLASQLENWENQKVNNVSENVLDLSEQLGYIQDDHQVLVGISYVDQVQNNDQTTFDDLSRQMETTLDTIQVASFEVPLEVREEAESQKASMNLVYASEVLGDEETEDRQQSEGGEEKDESNKPYKQINDKNKKVIEKFLQKTNKDEIPPGLQKKLEKFQDKEKSKNNKAKDESEQKGNKGKGQDNKPPKNEKSDDHPSQKKGNNSEKGKGNNGKGPGKGNGNGKGNSNQGEQNWTPPGLDKKDKPGKNNENEKFGESSEEEDEEGFMPSGLKDKDDDHPGKQNHKGKFN
ncbi:anti-sigma factor domain-containing protein [Aquisalibacillus elongatus]|uniref:RsgI N-terminal anti-sigma domain-containing protein n=1 Tax=Aquisalibacillus elongatus TaxID=485577 RepID=A0A3N5BKB6_9BACI|nr:anti-sigma factor domain-containing protein [Aquisalibacillus elongatus]RPF50128.1 hypothetical protein EDC24_2946 [Aquisalibacillus elongatus]